VPEEELESLFVEYRTRIREREERMKKREKGCRGLS
jgi:transcriptional accessory protein Tex/SPT6